MVWYSSSTVNTKLLKFNIHFNIHADVTSLLG